MARWPSKAKSDWKLRPRAGSFQRKSLERGMFARAMACGLCWSWLWVACAGAAHMPALPIGVDHGRVSSGGPRHEGRLVLSGRGDAVGASRGSHWGAHTPDTGTRRTRCIRATPSPHVTRRRPVRAPATVDLAEPPVETWREREHARAGDKSARSPGTATGELAPDYEQDFRSLLRGVDVFGGRYAIERQGITGGSPDTSQPLKEPQPHVRPAAGSCGPSRPGHSCGAPNPA